MLKIISDSINRLKKDIERFQITAARNIIVYAKSDDTRATLMAQKELFGSKKTIDLSLKDTRQALVLKGLEHPDALDYLKNGAFENLSVEDVISLKKKITPMNQKSSS